MPLLVEVRVDGTWRPIGGLITGTPPGSMSHNGPAGRQIYKFECHGDHSILERSEAGVDVEIGPGRLLSSVGLEQIARLSASNPSYEFWLKTDRSPEPRRVRFTHRD